LFDLINTKYTLGMYVKIPRWFMCTTLHLFAGTHAHIFYQLVSLLAVQRSIWLYADWTTLWHITTSLFTLISVIHCLKFGRLGLTASMQSFTILHRWQSPRLLWAVLHARPKDHWLYG